MTDAATTLPSTTDHRLPTTWWHRLGGIIAAPVAGFRALVDDPKSHPLEPLLVYAVVALGIAAADVYRLASLAKDAPLVITKRLLDVVLRTGRTDFAVVVVAALVVGGVAHARAAPAERRRFVGAAIATAYLLVPLSLSKAIGGLLAVLPVAGGVDLWWLPHHAVDSLAVVVASPEGRHLSPLRFVVKCVVAYGPGLAVLLLWLANKGGSYVRAYVARVGLSVGVVVVGVFVVAAAVDVGRRSDVLRPKQRGDVFPSVALKKLDADTNRKGGRADVSTIAKAPGVKVTVVDFWASWCGPCRRSMPELSVLNRGWASSDPGAVVVVGVNREPTDLAAARAAWEEMQPSFHSLVDDRGLGEQLGLNSLPSSYVLDRRGVIRHLHLGYVDVDVLKAEVDALLAESP